MRGGRCQNDATHIADIYSKTTTRQETELIAKDKTKTIIYYFFVKNVLLEKPKIINRRPVA